MDDSKTGVFAMNGLQAFRTRLGTLRWRRAFVRWQTAVSQTVVYAVLALAALLVIDFSLRLGIIPRAMVILAAGCVLVWKASRRVGPILSRYETLVDIALSLERTHHMDSDLVAALQFDDSVKAIAGSRELQQAVIDRAASISHTLDFRSAVPWDDARRAASWAAIAVVAVALCAFAFPNHASAFWNRLWLGDARYPTRTSIDEVTINGRPEGNRVVEGESIVFQVKCSGVTPHEGVAKLRGIETGDSTDIKLKRVDEAIDFAMYAADGPALNEPVEVSIHIGDAETDARSIALVRRPLVELTIEAKAPAYMQFETVRQREHYAQVMEGSAIEFDVRCTNGKRLKEVRLELNSNDERANQRKAIAFARADDAGEMWQLAPDRSGLTRVVTEVPYRVVVVDEDEFGTYHPIEGTIRIKPDRPPTASLASLHHAIMPNGRPTITYATEDDFGVAAIVLHARRATSQQPEAEEQGTLSISIALPDVRTDIRGTQVLDLSQLELVEHDKLLVWLEVIDYRGEWPGVSTLSDAIELEVTDERGVLDAILRSDADAEQMLTDIIEKELGLRGDR